LGTEHYSVGQYDETGDGPENTLITEEGFRCNLYNASDSRFTSPYEWKYCKDMVVGQTYEVHWPHSAAGACRTPWQYQTPFLDGVYCRDGVITDTAGQVGIQAQVFTIVNDEDFFYSNLFDGMIIDGEKGMDVATYTGSTTGPSVNNEVCSQYTPITWHVDRKCHLISASSFDKMCMEMTAQADDMSEDLDPHGSRELAADELVANNLQNETVVG
jgi:Delta carbonic anhydrase